MLNTVTVNSEQHMVWTTAPCDACNTHNTQGRVLCYVRARKAARALHNTRHSTRKRRERKQGRERAESSVRRWRRSSRWRCDAPPP